MMKFSDANHKKTAAEHSIEKPIFLNFVNLSTNSCPVIVGLLHPIIPC